MITWLHSFQPSPVLATFGPLTIYWYGALYVVSILVAYWLTATLVKRLEPRDAAAAVLSRELPEFTFGLVVSGIVGARLYHILNELPYYLDNPSAALAIWRGGLAIHGALVAGVLYVWWYSKRLRGEATAGDRQRAFVWLLDTTVPVVLLGQALGRWGNYFNQELFGAPTDLPWGIPIELANRPLAFADATYFHPTFLYESLWDFVGAAILIAWQYRRTNPKLQATSPSGPNGTLTAYSLQLTAEKNGFIFFSYLLWVSLGRILVELLRVDQVPLTLGVRLPLLVSVGLLVVGLTGLIALTRRARHSYT